MLPRLLLSLTALGALVLPAAAGAQNPGQAENVEISPMVLQLLGRAAPANRDPASRSQNPDGDLGNPAIRLTVTPARATVGRRTRFRFTATVAGDGSSLPPRIDCTASSARRAGACSAQAGAEPVAGARVTFAGASARTDRRGHATITKRLRRVGRFMARATKAGLDPGTTSVRAVRRRRGSGGGQTGGSGCRDQRNAQFRSERDRQRCERIGVSR